MARGIIDRVIGLEEKEIWRIMTARVEKLPADYQQDFKVLKKYLFTVGPSDWASQKFIFENLIDLLEELAAEKRLVTDVAGKDVAAFLDDLIASGDSGKSWEHKYRERLNRKIKAGDKK